MLDSTFSEEYAGKKGLRGVNIVKDKMVAAFLSLIFFVQVVTPVVYAAETANEVLSLIPDDVPSESQFIEPDLPEEEQAKAYILMEDPEKREEKVKTFLMSDGSYLAEVYPDAVHYKEEDGEWKNLDGAKKVNHQIVDNSQKMNGDDAFLFLQNLTSIVRYQDAFRDVDVEYILFSNRVKENIDIKLHLKIKIK